MTIDNHPLTSKAVDDRGAAVCDHQPTKADRAALEAIDDALGFLMDDERAIVLQAFARHREQAERGLREALEAIKSRRSPTFGPGNAMSGYEASLIARKALGTRP